MSATTCSARSPQARRRAAASAFRPRACRRRRKRCRSSALYGGFDGEGAVASSARSWRCGRRARHSRDDRANARRRAGRPRGAPGGRSDPPRRGRRARPVGLQDLATSAGMSKYHFLRVFRRLTGMTPLSIPHQRQHAPRRARARFVPPAGAVHRARQRDSATSRPSTTASAPRSEQRRPNTGRQACSLWPRWVSAADAVNDRVSRHPFPRLAPALISSHGPSRPHWRSRRGRRLRPASPRGAPEWREAF